MDTLQADGYQCIGPQVRQRAILYETIATIDQLPMGVRISQAPGSYQLTTTDDTEYFHWTTGPQAIKPHLFRPSETLWSCEKSTDGALHFQDQTPLPQKIAIIGVRACDIAALYIQDKHFLHCDIKDPYYQARRQSLFLVAVNCCESAATCFCASTGDGPQVTYGYDLLLTEIGDGFIVEALSQPGIEVLKKLPTQSAATKQLQSAELRIANATTQQRRLPSHHLKTALLNQLDHPQWQAIAERCLSCGNCTSVCPTCFCHSEADVPALRGDHTDHIRQWDSCFTADHSYIHGITIRASTSQRYRQWLTHKLGTWHDQYGRSGCVGCGRCISWCPVGIDLTEEVHAICGEKALP